MVQVQLNYLFNFLKIQYTRLYNNYKFILFYLSPTFAMKVYVCLTIVYVYRYEPEIKPNPIEIDLRKKIEELSAR